MQRDQFERRFNSIRSLPQGQFTKFKKMFESENKMGNERQNKQTNANLKEFRIEMDKIFEGVSDETNQLLSSLCFKNQQVADFFHQSKTKFNSSKDNLNEISISSFLSDSSSLSSDESKKTPSSNIYTEIWSETDNTDLKSPSNTSFNSGLLKSGNKTSLTIQEPNDTMITYAIESDDMDTCFRSHSVGNSSNYSFPWNFQNRNGNQIFSSNLLKIKNEAQIPYISDDSSIDDYTEQFNSDKSVQFECPPPKPVRTFEYDVYLKSKNIDNIDKSNKIGNRLNEHIYETLPFFRNTNQDISRKKVLKDCKKNNIAEKKTKNFNHSSQKFALSEPNLSKIGTNKNIRNEKAQKPFEKFFNNIFKKKNIRKINDKNNNQKLINNKSALKDNHSVQQSVTLRNNQKMLGKNLVTKSYIYSDPNESIHKINTLFDYVLIVGLKNRKYHSTDQLDSSDFINKTNPDIIWRFPDDSFDINPSIPEFCFPDALSLSEYFKKKYSFFYLVLNILKYLSRSEIFQFTLTNLEGKRTYGYCIRLLRKSKAPIVICILSEIDALEMYYTILNEIEKISLTSGLEQIKNFLRSLYPKQYPSRGESVLVTLGFTDKKEIILNRSIDKRLEHINLYTILSFPFDLIINVFAAMLMEKKLIFISNKLSFLSSTIHAFETLLYPFNWPHTYIPVLPSFLIEMTEAPTPYIIGMMRSCKNELVKYKNSTDILIIDLDKHKLSHNTRLYNEIIPENLKKSLKMEINILTNLSKNMSNYEKNLELCKIFINFFVKTIGNYRNYLVSVKEKENKDETIKFLYKDFINSSQNEEIRMFLHNFSQSQLFEVFISKKMQSDLNFGMMFDEAIEQEKAHLKNKLLERPNTPPLKHLGKFYFKI